MISRRNFLKLAGFAFLAPHISIQPIPHGRLLTTTVTSTGKKLLADSVHPILSIHDHVVQIPAGNIPITMIQPLLEPHHTPIGVLPQFVEVVAPYAVVRAYASAEASLVARIGHGGVLKAAQLLLDKDHLSWLQVDEGWLQRQHVQPLLAIQPIPHAHLEIEDFTLTLLVGHEVLLQTEIVRPQQLLTGTYRTHQKTINRILNQYVGVPYWLDLDDQISLHGVYWHNHFRHYHGENRIELPIITAKTVFNLLPQGARLVVK